MPRDEHQLFEYEKYEHALALRKYSRAQMWLERALTRAETEFSTTYQRLFTLQMANLKLIRNDPQGACDVLEKAYCKGIANAQVRIWRSRVLLDWLNDVKAAKEELHTVLAMPSTKRQMRHEAYTMLGRAYLKMGDADAALRCLKSSVRVGVLSKDLSLLEDMSRQRLYPKECAAALRKLEEMERRKVTGA